MEHLNVFYDIDSLSSRLKSFNTDTGVGLVPTMGALHEGHMELIKLALQKSKVVIVSIFVNPAQFNKKEDLENYPRSLNEDVQMINELGDVLVFAPSAEEMYPDDLKPFTFKLGKIADIMEGTFRPGHFEGVTKVIKRFIDIIHPDFAVFGEKDYQQLAIIQLMIDELNLPVEIIPCKTIRENSGLAMSSRNRRLSNEQKEDALIIYNTIQFVKSNWEKYTPIELKQLATEFFNKGKLDLEYLDIVDPGTLMSIDRWTPNARVCIAANCGVVRLIDNDVINEI